MIKIAATSIYGKNAHHLHVLLLPKGLTITFICCSWCCGGRLYFSVDPLGSVNIFGVNKKFWRGAQRRGFRATSLSTYDFSTLYTTLPHNLINMIKEKLLDLIEWTFKRSLKTIVLFIWPVMTENRFSLLLTKVDILIHIRMYAMP